MSHVRTAWSIFFAIGLFVFLIFFLPDLVSARNITQYKDTISNSAPGVASNHTFSFKLDTTVGPGASFEITPPSGFEILSTSTFVAERNVELRVNGILRSASSTLDASTDLVELFPGAPGMIRYTLNSSTGISAGSVLELKVGNHTSKSLQYSVEFSSTTGTTTTIADEKPIINSINLGTHKIALRVFDGAEVADADFHIAIIDAVGVGPVDTTEEIPPERFNGAPSTTVTGVTASVEIFLETNELAVCKFSTVPDVDFASMPNTFANTGLIYHTQVVAVTPNSTQTFYVRCIDDEGNFNIDDYLIQFAVTDIPTGTANEEGETEGDGTGTGDSGTGSGGGGGGQSGQSDGVAPTTGGSSGGGGSGGGGGGRSGEENDPTAGGGFEANDAPYQSGDGRVTITGFAYPRSTIVVLVDGKEAERVQTGTNGSFSAVIDEIARGVYTFGVYAEDPGRNRSATFSTSFTVTGARTSALSNINLSPSLKVSPDPVTPGAVLTISGYALPNSTVTIENEKEGAAASRKTLSANAGADGTWSITLPTDGFSVGTYKARARSAQASGVTTNFSNYTFYGVGQSAVRPNNADLNRDGKVNLVDFSILLFWWSTDGGTSDPSADINGDGRVNLVDFSILLFNWTG